MSKSAKAPGEFWDRRYDGDDYVFGQDPNLWMASHESLLTEGMTALVPGDGEGRNGVWLAERGLVVTTVDASQVGVEKAQYLAAARGVEINTQVADLRDWNPPKSTVDLAVLAFVHVDVDERTAVHHRVAETLKPGGLLLLEGFSPDHLGYGRGGPSDKIMMFTEAGLREDFADMLDIEHLAEVKTVIPDSERHGGPAMVVQLRGRRKNR